VGIVAVVEPPGTRTGGFDQEWHFTGRRTFLVETDDASVDEIEVLADPRIPRVSNYHPVYALAAATNVDASQPDADAPWFWSVVVTYSTRSVDPDRQNKDKDQSPLFEPPVIRWGKTVATVPFIVAADDSFVLIVRDGEVVGKTSFADIGTPSPVQNSAGEQHDPAYEVEVRRQVLTIDRNEASFDPDRADRYMDTTNSRTFFGRDPGTMRCTDFTGERDFKKGVAFAKVHYEFEHKEDGWDIDIPDVGTVFVKRTDDGEYMRTAFTDSAGRRYIGKLNGHGEKAEADPNNAVNGVPEAIKTFYLRYRRYPRKDFAPLKLSDV
jgi:hypothetical protein